MARIELLVARDENGTHLLSPGVGHFTQGRPRGSLLAPGDVAGVIETLGVARELIVPASVTGRIVSDPPQRVHEPVGYRSPLYTLSPIDAAAADAAVEERAGPASGALVFRAPYSGRFWHRPSPNDPAFVSEGDVFAAGATIGLIEVMKTFTHLHYDATGELPEKARAVRLLVGDGEEVSQGDPLIEVEGA